MINNLADSLLSEVKLMQLRGVRSIVLAFYTDNSCRQCSAFKGPQVVPAWHNNNIILHRQGVCIINY